MSAKIEVNRTAAARLVIIDWEDSSGPAHVGWHYLPETVLSPKRCFSVGWLYHDRRDYKLIVPHVEQGRESGPDLGSGQLLIPTRCIVRMYTIQEPKGLARKKGKPK